MTLPDLHPRDDRERFLFQLFERLWAGYRAKMPPVKIYETLAAQRGLSFTNDHIAFRTLGFQRPALGTFCLSRVFEALGYRAAGCHAFPDKHLSAVHFQHPHPRFPKIFISQLNTWALSPRARERLGASLRRHRPLPGDETLAALAQPPRGAPARAALLKVVLDLFQKLPWPLPEKKDVLALNRESQYAAWTLLNGYGVNHFTAAVDPAAPADFNDIEKVAAALTAAGVPMKKEIEGAPGSKLRQTSTEAVVAPTPVREGRRRVAVPWTYAYFEIAERPLLTDPATGRRERFEGFLGGQAAQLFDMTRFSGPAGP